MQRLRYQRSENDPSRGRAALRASTSEIHERLHGAPAFAALAQGRLDRPAYGDLLGRLLAFHRAVAPQMGRARATIGWQDGEGSAARIARLEADLSYVGPSASPQVGTPEWHDDEAVGGLYVVEGSAVGGKVIHRQLDYLFSPDERGRSFFGGSRSDGQRWRELCGRLDVHGACEVRLAGMIAGAVSAFRLFEMCLGAGS